MKLVFIHINCMLIIASLILTIFYLQSLVASILSLLCNFIFYYVNIYKINPILYVCGNTILVFQLFCITNEVIPLQFHISTLIFTAFFTLLDSIKGNPLIYHFFFKTFFVIFQFKYSRNSQELNFSLKDYLISGLILISLNILYLKFLMPCINYYIKMQFLSKSIYLYSRLIENLSLGILIINDKLEILSGNKFFYKSIFHKDPYPKLKKLHNIISITDKKILSDALHQCSKKNKEVIVKLQLILEFNNKIPVMKWFEFKISIIEWIVRSRCY